MKTLKNEFIEEILIINHWMLEAKGIIIPFETYKKKVNKSELFKVNREKFKEFVKDKEWV